MFVINNLLKLLLEAAVFYQAFNCMFEQIAQREQNWKHMHLNLTDGLETW